jgi:diaminohydroxyphosphoribosylaminopyrimidine deaminase/5-amino-6-(5-phosphoribosylamino)uracil reductase
MSVDEKWMRRALALAEKGRGFVHPNPMVGAVLVRGDRVVAEDFHRRFGQAHAEAQAITGARRRAKGATLYINLEPCAHWGKTPPCVNAIMAAGIRRVVAAMQDPNPLVSGRGFAALRRHGISVTIGVLEKEARHLNRAFTTWVRHKRPFVTLKIARSLDGRAATITGESKWLTGKKARQAGHRLRAQVDAVAVGADTVLKDDPLLTAHGAGRNPVRIVFAGRRRLPSQSQIFNQAAATWVIKDARGVVNLRRALAELAQRGIAHLLVEGGPTLQESFLAAGIVDEVVIFLAPLIVGNAKRLKDAWGIREMQTASVGKDVCITGRVAARQTSERSGG